MKFETALQTIKQLLKQSNGKPIKYGKSEFIFKSKSPITAQQIEHFEKSYQLSLPSSYKTFALELGACSIFENEYGIGYEFLSPSEFLAYSQAVFGNTGTNLFPNIVLVVRNRAIAGFLTTQSQANFAEFYADTPPEYWIEESEFCDFENWINHLLDFYLDVD